MKNLFICLGLLLLLGLYLSSKLDWEDMLQPRAKTPVHLNGKIAPKPKSLPEVKLVSIPQEVYDSIKSNTWGEYISGNQKYVLVINWGGKPGPSFKKTLKTLFNQKGYREYYRKHVVTIPGHHFSISCSVGSQSCPKLWLHENCTQKVCIINPRAKKVIVDSSADVKQLETLLEKYKDW